MFLFTGEGRCETEAEKKMDSVVGAIVCILGSSGIVSFMLKTLQSNFSQSNNLHIVYPNGVLLAGN